MSLQIHFHDVPHSDTVRSACERLAEGLSQEFPETSKYEVTLSHSKGDHEAHVNVTGRDIDVAAAAEKRDLAEAVTEGFERVRRQLRKHHDKQIFSRRRTPKP